MSRRPYKPNLFHCSFPRCSKSCKTERGLRQHEETCHYVLGAQEPPQQQPKSPSPHLCAHNSLLPIPTTPPDSPSAQVFLHPARQQSLGSPNSDTEIKYHQILDGTPCDALGNDLPPGSPPPPCDPGDTTDYSPFVSQAEFELAEFLYTKEEMSEQKTNRLMDLLNALYTQDGPPFSSHEEMCSVIDAIHHGDIPWQSFNVTYNGELPTDGPVPTWKTQPFEIDYAPKRVTRKGKRQYTDLMSGNWAWSQADKIVNEDLTGCNVHGAMFSPWIFGSDKTTVSVATGQNEYYPLYQSCGNVHNSIRRAHCNAVTVIASKDQDKSAEFRKFRRQLFHTSLEYILSSMRPYMTEPKVTKCPDGHYRRVVYGIGPYIADYPEQALLSCIVQNWCPKCLAPVGNLDGDGEIFTRRSHEHTNALLDGCTLKELWDDFGIVGDLLPFTISFPRADIHELLSPDLLHQIIKGTFKDHLVDWVTEYIEMAYSKAEATRRLADIDRRKVKMCSAISGAEKFS
ncbi:hypothetical protein E1B28_004814 [Marasmius oreades]|uniref:C2H2-type domain-containing protein n=1 Tax=Marasmius oreades TaxID=181124 RepID=A0A9P7UZH5_9AGAR|nr:uncharacterized protein E1B28_004814 [Marasmius oreades]KAG7097471.1 hypothetical protein E1B28_004814 [Marasmius oreades]